MELARAKEEGVVQDNVKAEPVAVSTVASIVTAEKDVLSSSLTSVL